MMQQGKSLQMRLPVGINQAIYLGRSRRDGRDDEEPYLSSEDIMIAKYQWMQVSSP